MPFVYNDAAAKLLVVEVKETVDELEVEGLVEGGVKLAAPWYACIGYSAMPGSCATAIPPVDGLTEKPVLATALDITAAETLPFVWLSGAEDEVYTPGRSWTEGKDAPADRPLVPLRHVEGSQMKAADEALTSMNSEASMRDQRSEEDSMTKENMDTKTRDPDTD